MKPNYPILLLILFTFFVISFLTNIIGPLIPEIIEDFNLSLFLVGFLPFAFFLAYGVWSIPAGILMERIGAKRMMLIAFVIAFVGAFAFALFHNYLFSVLSLFLIGSGMAMLQVVLYPMLRTTGGEEHFAFNSVLAQLSFGLASFLSPLVYSRLVRTLQADGEEAFLPARLLNKVVPEGLEWISMYWVFAAIAVLMLVIVAVTRFPRVELTEEERSGDRESYRELLAEPVVWLYFLGIFFYVGTEQGINSWTSQFLQEYHGLDPQTAGARAVSRFWGWMTIGTVVGLVILRLFDSRRVLIVAVSLSIIALTAALFGSAGMATLAFPLIGFFISVVFAIVIDLGLNSFDRHHGTFAGILLSGIVGGAVWTLLIGAVGDLLGLRSGLFLLYLSLAYLLGIGFWARPLVRNKTIDWGGKAT